MNLREKRELHDALTRLEKNTDGLSPDARAKLHTLVAMRNSDQLTAISRRSQRWVLDLIRVREAT